MCDWRISVQGGCGGSPVVNKLELNTIATDSPVAIEFTQHKDQRYIINIIQNYVYK